MGHHRRHILDRNKHGQPGYGIMYPATMLFGFHWMVVAYTNSTFMENFTSPESIGTLYTIGSTLSVLIFLFTSRVLQKVGNTKFTITLAFLELAALAGLALAESASVAIPLFILHLMLTPLIIFNLDIFSESISGDNEASTGSKRGAILTLMSLASAIAPLAAGYAIGYFDGDLSISYSLSMLFLVPFIALIMWKFRNFTDPAYKEIKVLPTIREFWIDKDIRNVFLAHFSLQVFFTWMVIYAPLYLATEIGFTWPEIGKILAVGLSAYVLFEYLIGYLADKYIGEKEMMALGFVILAISSSWFSFLAGASMVIWMIAVFMTRTGAALVEATTESYFFKHTEGSDANVISFFRITRPLASLSGALLGSFTLLYLPFELMFVVLGLLMIPGIFFTVALKDTK